MPATIQLRSVSKLGEFFAQCCLFGTVLLLALGGCQSGEPDAAPADLPAECSYFGKNQTTKIPFTIENPRRVGDHYFESEDGGSHSNQRFEPTDREVYVYDFEFYELILDDSGKIVAPIYPTTRGFKKEALFERRYAWIPPDPRVYLNSKVPDFRIPFSKKISKYIFVIRSLSEATGWRVFEVDRAKVEDATKKHPFQFPDLLSLRPLDMDNADDARLWELVEIACKYTNTQGPDHDPGANEHDAETR